MQTTEIASAIDSFIRWLDDYGETSHDHQSFYASKLGRGAKALYYRQRLLGTLAVGPMVFCEAFVPGARRLFWKKQRFPIADAHYAMGFAFLAATYGGDEYYRRAVHFLEVLRETRCRGYEDFCWGYPFDWQTRTGTMKAGTPMITTLPYVYEAFSRCMPSITTRSGFASCARLPSTDLAAIAISRPLRTPQVAATRPLPTIRQEL